MKAMVFAAGVGSRLKELTVDTPKCLVKLVDGSTMLDRVIIRLREAGVREIIINLFHQPEKIVGHVAAQKSYGISIEYSKEDTLLGTGGGLYKARSFFDSENFFVHNSDIFTDLDLSELYSSHVRFNACATLAVMHRPTSRPLLFTENYSLAGWVIGNDKQELIPGVVGTHRVGFSGVQVLSPRIFQYLALFDGNYSTISAFMAAAKGGELVCGYDMTDRFWIDMGTPDKLAALNERLGTGL